jgi:hypothetical protein
MGFFSRSTKVSASTFAKSYYDAWVFAAGPTGLDFPKSHAETTQRLISEVSPSFAAVSLPNFKEELLALRMEMIGTAWTHASDAEAALQVSEFTKDYLTAMHRSDLWKTMTEYNKAVADSSTYGADPETKSGRARIAFVNSLRANLFSDWVAQGRDGQAAARVANRVGSDTSWDAGITPLVLAVEVARRIDIEGSEPIVQRLAAVAYGFYQGAKEALDGVRLVSA